MGSKASLDLQGSRVAIALVLLRDVAVAPAAEEWVFRACMAPLLLEKVHSNYTQNCISCSIAYVVGRRLFLVSKELCF